MRTSSKHALHKVIDIAEYNPEALWSALLAHQRLDLNALQYWLRYSGIRIFAGVEYCTEERCKYLDQRGMQVSPTRVSLD